MGKRELVALLNLSSWCLVMVEQLFLAVPWGCLRFVIVVFPDHTHYFPSEMRRGYLVCVKYNSNSFHSFILTLNNNCSHIENVHLLFCTYLMILYSSLGLLNLDSFFRKMLRGCLVCVICNAKKFHSLIFKLCIIIVHTLNMCTSLFVHIY